MKSNPWDAWFLRACMSAAALAAAACGEPAEDEPTAQLTDALNCWAFQGASDINLRSGVQVVPVQCDTGNGVLSVVSEGDGIYSFGHHDQMKFVWTRIDGNFEIVARLVDFRELPADGGAPQKLPQDAQAGIAIRAGLGGDAPMVAAYAEVDGYGEGRSRPYPDAEVHDDDIVANFRFTPDDQEEYYKQNNSPPYTLEFPWEEGTPIWFRIQRVGNDVSVARASDTPSGNKLWVPVGGGAITMTPGSGNPPYVGVFAAGHTRFGTAKFDNITIGPLQGHRTNWVGSTYAKSSTSFISRGITAMYVAPNGATYKTAPKIDFGQEVQRYVNGVLTRTNYSGHGGKQGGITGDGVWGVNGGSPTYIYVATECAGQPTAECVMRLRADTLAVEKKSSVAIPRIGGLAFSPPNKLYVSDVGTVATPGVIRVLKINLADPGQDLTEDHSFTYDTNPLAQPGPIVVDRRNDVWVLQGSADYPIPGQSRNPARQAKVRCFRPSDSACTGAFGVLKQILLNAESNPSALAYDPTPGAERLLVAENGLWSIPTIGGQNIRVFGNLTDVPVEQASFGVNGGVYAATPGLISHPVTGDERRFYSPVGVGIDQSMNIYVASGRMVDIRAFNPSSGIPLWRMHGLLSDEVGGFDPGTGGWDFYSSTKRFSFNPLGTVTGKEWTHRAVTWDPLKYNEGTNELKARVGQVADVRRIRFQHSDIWYTERFLFTYRGLEIDPSARLSIFRFDGEIAVPSGYIEKTAGQVSLWSDTDGDGLVDCPDEGNPETCEIKKTTGTPLPNDANFGGYSVDKDGTIWISSGPPGIYRFKPTGFTTTHAPLYSLATTGSPTPPLKIIPIPQLASVWNALHDELNDVMVVVGRTLDNDAGVNGSCSNPPDGYRSLSVPCEGATVTARDWYRHAYARFTTWGDGTGTCAYVRTAPDALDSPQWAFRAAPYCFVPVDPDPNDGEPAPPPEVRLDGETESAWKGAALAGDKLFMYTQKHPIYVFDTKTGEPESTLFEGAEQSGTAYNNESTNGLTALKLPTGEYLVATSDSGNWARNIVYRYAPAPALVKPPNKWWSVGATAQPRGIAAAPDGSIWFAMFGTNTLGRIPPTLVEGSYAPYPLPPVGGINPRPMDMVAGPDGNMYFTEYGTGQIGCVNVATNQISHRTIAASSGPRSIAVGPDGYLWFTEFSSKKIGRLPPSCTNGTVVPQESGVLSGKPWDITANPDGKMWFTVENTAKVGYAFIQNGVIATFENTLPSGSSPTGIASVGFGQVLYAASPLNRIGKYPGGLGVDVVSWPVGMTVDVDGNPWVATDTELVKLTSSGAVAARVPVTHTALNFVTSGPDANLWVTSETGWVGMIPR